MRTGKLLMSSELHLRNSLGTSLGSDRMKFTANKLLAELKKQKPKK
jgi:hypothetical protein